jgi:hypothetical protein
MGVGVLGFCGNPSVAVDPGGPWSTATTIAGLDGIDPDLAWDEDGTCYISYCSTGAESPSIAQAQVDLERGVIVEEPRLIWSGTGLAHPEAPHLYRVGRWWYLLIAEGGTERGHSVSIARSSSPMGPFESNPGNPFFSHRSLAHPVQNTGHADLVENEDGSWAMVYLGVRARGETPLYHVNGRETFLAGVDWVGGWPVVDEERYQIPVPDRSYVDDFTTDALDLRWVSPGSGLERIRRDDGPGIVLHAKAVSADLRVCVVARVTDLRWRFSVEVTCAATYCARWNVRDRRSPACATVRTSTHHDWTTSLQASKSCASALTPRKRKSVAA